MDKLKYASHIAKIVFDVTTENQNSYRILQLLLNTLYVISETDKDLNLVVSIFKLRLLSILGFMPKLKKCVNCEESDQEGKHFLTHFSFCDNGFKCDNCAKLDTSAPKISQATVDAIRYIFSSPPKKLFSFNIPEDSKKELEIVAKVYFNDKLEKEYKL